MSLTHEIRVFCPTHEASFEVSRTAKVQCEITGHTLASNFPTSEIWEFCCNCNTFSPSKLDKGEKARRNCFSCHNEIIARTLCPTCKTFSFAAQTKTKGQKYFIDQTGIGPFCPGCDANKEGGVVLHQCNDVDTAFFTSIEICPFCLEETRVGFVLPNRQQQSAQNICSSCRSVNPEAAAFCGSCRSPLKGNISFANPGSEAPRSIVGTMCPNCSSPIPGDADFCGECGQAIKRSGAPPPPPPPRPASPNSTGDKGVEKGTLMSGSLSEPEALTKILKNPIFAVSIAAGALVVLIIGAAAITRNNATQSSLNANNVNRPNAYNYNSAIGNAKNAAANQAAMAANTAASNANNTLTTNSNVRPSNSGSLIGRTGTLGWDTALREYPTKDSMKLGVHYRGASFEVLEVAENIPNDEGGTSRWYRVKIVRYGESVDPKNEGLSKDYDSGDIGWVNGVTHVWKGQNRDRKVRERIILLDR